MNSTANLELSDRQRDILLRGLRFVRRSYTLDFVDTSDVTPEQRKAALAEIQQLNSWLESGRTKQTAAAR